MIPHAGDRHLRLEGDGVGVGDGVVVGAGVGDGDGDGDGDGVGVGVGDGVVVGQARSPSRPLSGYCARVVTPLVKLVEQFA